MNIFKIVVVICTAVFSSHVLSVNDLSKEGELVPDPSTYSSFDVKTPEQIREETYQRIVNKLEQMKLSNPDNDNPRLIISISADPAYVEADTVYDFLMSTMQDMPKESYYSFEYLRDGDSGLVFAKVNREGVEYLNSLGSILLGWALGEEH